jgi:sortase A
LESVFGSSFYIVIEVTPAAGDDIYWTENIGDDVLTLITCYPFNYVGKAEDRYIIRGELIDPRPKG